ncbi:helix-turn-helix transcriptional regulator [Alkalicella caledoniensis]|uniref:Helix-turn-helix transcriptional regulator n=1 Tax=Alkalicella caledoniensis TaxID=2731377 RepID=A0A7G9W468_ALKCA|nr:helix-turn-helix transcriptional regulator [Alkalicella caledoniensis]QNO13480.1 helix-turn-helix transcriptional regulator [Alkalicella caledoniensis]
MSYNLAGFGANITDLRKNLKLTQKNISETSGIHVDTLRKIEKGKVIPTQETLDLLSLVLNKDLNKLLLNYRLQNYLEYQKTSMSIEAKLDKDDFNELAIELDRLNQVLNKTSHLFFINQIKQLQLLIESIILNKKHDLPLESLSKLIQAICITTGGFTLNSYENFVYNTLELRILMNIALILNKTESAEKSLEIMEFCIKMVDPSENLYPKICYNLAYTYHRLDLHEKALEYSKLGIEFCNYYRNYNGLNLLYHRKGVAEYHLGIDSYLSSLKKAINFCDVLGQEKLKKLLIDNCKKFYNIEL